MILAVTAMVGDGLDHGSAAIDLDRCALRPHLTADEAAFLADRQPSAEQGAAYSYRGQGAAAILWALGMLAGLDAIDPDAVAEECTKLLSADAIESLLSRARYRDASEILDEEDFYRLYRAVYASLVPPGTAVGMERQVGPATRRVAG